MKGVIGNHKKNVITVIIIISRIYVYLWHVEGAERAAPWDRTQPQGSGKEETAAGRDRDEGELGTGIQRVRATIESVTAFKYLGIILTATDEKWSAVVVNLGDARRSWGRLSRMLNREGADPKVLRAFYIAVTQAVFLFGSETWVLTARMEKALDSFQSRVARRIMGRQTWQRKNGS